MQERPSTWIVVVDNRTGRLLEGRRTAQGRVHLEERAALANPRSEHVAGGLPEPTTRDKFGRATERHEEEEKLHRFAREVASWLEQQVSERHLERLELFAPARFRGALRKALPARLNGCLREHEGDLAHLQAGELARHPAVAGVVPEPAVP